MRRIFDPSPPFWLNAWVLFVLGLHIAILARAGYEHPPASASVRCYLYRTPDGPDALTDREPRDGWTLHAAVWTTAYYQRRGAWWDVAIQRTDDLALAAPSDLDACNRAVARIVRAELEAPTLVSARASWLLAEGEQSGRAFSPLGLIAAIFAPVGLGLLALAPVLGLGRAVMAHKYTRMLRRLAHNRCPTCTYNITGIDSTCPECGCHLARATSKAEHALRRRRRH